MKKLLFLFSIVLVSCSTESSKGIHTKDGSSILKEAVMLHNEDEPFVQAEYFESDLEFGVVGDNLIIVNNDNTETIKYYSVQLLENTISDLKNLKSGKWEVAFFGPEIIIGNDEEIFYFSVLDTPQYPDIFERALGTRAIGIINDELDKDDQLVKNSSGNVDFLEIERRLQCKCVAISSFDYCDSGGEGSSSCSNSSCSVSCNKGYFACCVNKVIPRGNEE